jgi:mRNA interferase MazF
MIHGEIWLVNFQPQVKTEITKTRPALILSDTALQGLSTRIVVPFRDTKPHHSSIAYYVIVQPNAANALDKVSSADCSQIKSFDVSRFVKKLGTIAPNEMERVVQSVCLCIGA